MRSLARAYQEGKVDIPEFTRAGMQNLNALREWEQEPNMPAAHVSALFGAQGPNMNCLSADRVIKLRFRPNVR